MGEGEGCGWVREGGSISTRQPALSAHGRAGGEGRGEGKQKRSSRNKFIDLSQQLTNDPESLSLFDEPTLM